LQFASEYTAFFEDTKKDGLPGGSADQVVLKLQKVVAEDAVPMGAIVHAK
jgi:hypothetical protein